jgi:phosphoadenosine phosphosulfate reductase
VPSEIAGLNAEHAQDEPAALLKWTLGRYKRVAIASSFGAEDVALIDMAVRIDPNVRVFTLDTGRLNEETYEVMDRVRRKYGIAIEAYFPDAKAVERLEREKGFYSFRESVDNRKECCAVRKVEPLKRALSGLEAWIAGLRREQSVTRAGLDKVEWDAAFGLVKINPLADWTQKQVWDYVKQNQVPYNRLHDLGYPSIGCAPCTRAVSDKPSWEIPDADVRKGRWWWEDPDHKECGLHLPKK